MRLNPGGQGLGDGVSLQRQALGAESRDLPSLPTAPPPTEKLGARAQAPFSSSVPVWACLKVLTSLLPIPTQQ